MPKKDIKKATEGGADVFATLRSTNTRGTSGTKDMPKVKPERVKIPVKEQYYRFNLKMPLEYKDYLQEAAYKASTAKERVTITEYICRLIEKDMKANK